MNNLLNKVKGLIKHILAYVPTKLPIGMTEFDTWAKDVLALTHLPDNDSTRFALASIIPHQKAESFYVPKIKFAHLLLKSAANQVAGGVMHDLKEKQKAAIEAAAKQAEATAQDGLPVDQVKGT
jgi:hypothetical protein